MNGIANQALAPWMLYTIRPESARSVSSEDRDYLASATIEDDDEVSPGSLGLVMASAGMVGNKID
jgi:hypothetical protein